MQTFKEGFKLYCSVVHQWNLSRNWRFLHKLCVVCYVFLHKLYFKTLFNIHLWIYSEQMSIKLLIELLEKLHQFIWWAYKIIRFNRLYVDCFFSAANWVLLSESTACWVCCIRLSQTGIKRQSHSTVYLALQEK